MIVLFRDLIVKQPAGMLTVARRQVQLLGSA
jgi:hypothetical protein